MTAVEVDQISRMKLLKVGVKIKSQRMMKKITQEQLSVLTGIDKQTISRIESVNQEHNPELLSILKLAVAMDVDIRKFFDFSDLE